MRVDAREEVEAFARAHFPERDPTHDAWHAERVARLAQWILKQDAPDADPAIVHATAWLHDLLDPKVRAVTRDELKAFLQRVYPEKAERIMESMEHLGFRDRLQGLTPRTIEGWIVHDADKLDALGWIGLARALAYGGLHKRPLYTPGERPLRGAYPSMQSSLGHFHEKLFHLPRLLHFPSAKRLAAQRVRILRAFTAGFLREWYGLDVKDA